MGREPSLTELGIFGHVGRTPLVQSSEGASEEAADQGALGIRGRARMPGHRYRRRTTPPSSDGSHNHPRFIEPYRGRPPTCRRHHARCLHHVGARPIANLNALRFGAPDDAKTRHLISASSPASAATAIAWACRRWAAGAPSTASYNGNILVNAMTVGLRPTPQDLLFGGGRRPATR